MNFVSITILCLLVSCANACIPIGSAQKQIIDKLTKYLGVEPFYPNGVLGETAYSDAYIDDGSELNCNFNIQGQPPQEQLEDGSSNPSELCKWTNMVNGKYAIDNEDYYLFVRTSDNIEWIPMFPRTFSAPRTPPVGDAFAVTGSLQRSPAPQSVLYSNPIKCMKTSATLSFDYWLYNKANLHVQVLERKTFRVLWEVSKRDKGFLGGIGCGKFFPSDGRCSIEIPPQQKPFHLAIHSYDLHNSIAVVDNIRFDVELAPEFDFGTTQKSLTATLSETPIVTGDQLDCDGSTNCKWSNNPNADVKFHIHSDLDTTNPTIQARWKEATGDSTMPDGDFYMARGTTGEARLLGPVIDCQAFDGVLKFRSWQGEGTRLEVCVIDYKTLKPTRACKEIPRPMVNGAPHEVTVYGIVENSRIMFRAFDWNNGNGGFVAIDDIVYTGKTCTEVPLPTQAPNSPDELDQAACKSLTTNFDGTISSSTWHKYPPTSYSNHEVVGYDVVAQLMPTANSAVECQDGTKCAGLVVDRDKNQIGIIESGDIQLAADRHIQMHVKRGTYGSAVHICLNKPPTLTSKGAVQSSTQCSLVAGPLLSYTEYRTGLTVGATVPKGTTKIYLLFANPDDSGTQQAAFMFDNVQLLRGSTNESAPLC